MTLLLADIAVFPSRSDFFFPTPFLVENICLLLKFLRCSRGRLCRWMLSSQPLSMRSNRSLSMCGARQDISTVLPFGWNQLLDSLISEGGHVRRGRGREHLQRQFFHRGRWWDKSIKNIKISPSSPDCLVPLTTVSRRGIPESCLSNKLSRFTHWLFS